MNLTIIKRKGVYTLFVRVDTPGGNNEEDIPFSVILSEEEFKRLMYRVKGTETEKFYSLEEEVNPNGSISYHIRAKYIKF